MGKSADSVDDVEYVYQESDQIGKSDRALLRKLWEKGVRTHQTHLEYLRFKRLRYHKLYHADTRDTRSNKYTCPIERHCSSTSTYAGL